MRPKPYRLTPQTGALVLALACAMLLVTPSSVLADGPDCKVVSIYGVVDLSDFSGDACVAIQGEHLSAEFQVIPLQAPVPKDGGLYFPEVLHEFFNFSDGSALTTTGEELTVPTETPGIDDLYGYMVIIGGDGVFKDASGVLLINGQLNWSEFSGFFSAHGVIWY